MAAAAAAAVAAVVGGGAAAAAGVTCCAVLSMWRAGCLQASVASPLHNSAIDCWLAQCAAGRQLLQATHIRHWLPCPASLSAALQYDLLLAQPSLCEFSDVLSGPLLTAELPGCRLGGGPGGWGGVGWGMGWGCACALPLIPPVLHLAWSASCMHALGTGSTGSPEHAKWRQHSRLLPTWIHVCAMSSNPAESMRPTRSSDSPPCARCLPRFASGARAVWPCMHSPSTPSSHTRVRHPNPSMPPPTNVCTSAGSWNSIVYQRAHLQLRYTTWVEIMGPAMNFVSRSANAA